MRRIAQVTIGNLVGPLCLIGFAVLTDLVLHIHCTVTFGLFLAQSYKKCLTSDSPAFIVFVGDEQSPTLHRLPRTRPQNRAYINIKLSPAP